MKSAPDRFIARTSAMTSARRSARGFSLMELMITVAIVGIIAAIAVPSYSAYATKVRRTDATVLLLEMAGEQARYRSEFNAYTDDLTELGYDVADDVLSEEAFYTVSATVDAANPTTFLLTATPVPGGLQANDAECGAFTLNANGVKGSDGGADCW